MKYRRNHRPPLRLRWTVTGGLALCLAVLMAAQCRTNLPPPPSTPPLPATPSGPVLQIGLLSPNSGELNTFGRIMRNGVGLAFEEWNAQKSASDYRVVWQNYDTGCAFETAQQAVEQAVADGIKFLIGPLCSEAAIGAAVTAEANDLLMISPTATHPLVTVDHRGLTRPTIFRGSPTFPRQGQAMARFAYTALALRTAAIVTDPEDDYTVLTGNEFDHAFTELGGTVVYRATVSPPQAEMFTETLMAIDDAGAALIYLPLSPATVNRIAGQLRPLLDSSTVADVVLLGSDRWESEELDLSLTEGSYFTTIYFPSPDNETASTWAGTYKAAYAVEPDTLAALSYESATWLLLALAQSKTLEVNPVAQTMAHTQFPGLAGPITFDEAHNPTRPIPVVRVENQTLSFITVEQAPPP